MKALALVFVASLSTQTGCDKGSDATGPAANAPVIKLLDAGSGPKQTLRFTAEKGMKKVMVMSMDMGMTMDMGDSPNTQHVPTIDMTMDIVVIDVAKNGDIRYEFKLREPEVADDPNSLSARPIKLALAGMAGLSGSATVTSRGFAKQVDVKLPANASPQVAQFVESVKQSIGQMSAPLPEEPVGVGAKWETTTKLEQNSMKLQQVAISELMHVDGHKITFDVTLEQVAAPQKIVKDGVTVDLQTHAGSGSGRTTLDLTQLVPSNAHIDLKSETQMLAGGRQLNMGLDLKMSITSQ
jgi:hypothetical protein